MKPLVSVIIATYNSAKLLPLVLESIQYQNFNKKKLEILIVDGGSTDNTLNIAKENKCTIIHNPKTDPINAKYLGFIKSKGKYLIFLDHDEVIKNKESINLKIRLFSAIDEVKAVTGSGYENPQGYPVINEYINEFGDPFSFFIYRLSKHKNFFIKTMKQRYDTKYEDQYSVVFNLSSRRQQPIIELVAGSTMIDASFFKKLFIEKGRELHFLGQAFHHMFKQYPYMGVTKNDYLVHYSSDTFRKYFNKIKWRVKNNIFFSNTAGQAGFLGRETFQPKIYQYKKYLYIPYVFTFVFLVIDTIWLVTTRKNIFYVVHIPLSVYTASVILYYTAIKMLDLKLEKRSYDESKIISK